MALHPLFTDILHGHARVTEVVAPKAYRGWSVSQGRWPEPNWLASHPDYDASYEGPEDGWVGNGLSASADTYEALCGEIDAIMEEHPHFATDCALPRGEW